MSEPWTGSWCLSLFVFFALGLLSFMDKKYDFILADPCWNYRDTQGHDPARGGLTYPTMTMKELEALPVERLAKKDSIMVMWVTAPKLMDFDQGVNPLHVLKAWGFIPITILIVWVKTTKKGFYSGLGRYTNSNVELAIVARRGKGLERQAKNVKQLLFAPLRAHSEKPQEQYTRYESLWHIQNKQCIELFARSKNPPPSYFEAVGLDWTPPQDIKDFLQAYA